MNSRLTAVAAAAALLPLVLLPGAALAHTGHGDAGGFAHGVMHPVGGLDHVLAMIAVGLYAALLGGWALWLVPASFIGIMAIGGVLGMAGLALPHAEIGIALSVIVLGLAVALRLSLPTLSAMALVGVFAVFHGYAHGAEMPPDASGLRYAAGFLLATALLHGAGIALGFAIAGLNAFPGKRVTQVAGGAMTLAGFVLLTSI